METEILDGVNLEKKVRVSPNDLLVNVGIHRAFVGGIKSQIL